MPKDIRNIVILHGWGLSSEKYKNLSKIFINQGFKVTVPDLPGFGSIKNIDHDLILEDYALFLKKLIENNKLKNITLIGHSFGGRVIVCFLDKYKDLVGEYNIDSIVFTGAPLVKARLSFKKRLVVNLSRLGKKIINNIPLLDRKDVVFRKMLYKIIGEWDYYNSGNLRQTFINILKYDLQQKIVKIKLPTLIIWGKNDRIVSYSDAEMINKLISGSKLVGVENATHKLPYEKPDVFADYVISFIHSLYKNP